MIKIILEFNKYISYEHKREYFLIIFLSFFSSISEIISIGSIIPITSLFFDTENLRLRFYDLTSISLDLYSDEFLISSVLILFITLIIFILIIRVYLQKKIINLSYNIGLEISKKLFNKLLFQNYSDYLKSNSNIIISNITNKINQIVGGVMMPFIVLSSSLILSFFIISTLMFIDFKISLFAILYFSILYIIIGHLIKGKLNYNSNILSISSDNVIKILQESSGNFRDIYLHNMQNSILELFNMNETNYRRAQSSNAFISSVPKFLIESLGIVFLLSVSAYLYFTQNQDLSNVVPIIAVFAFGSQKLIPIFQQVFVSWSNFNGTKESFNDILKYLNKKSFSNNFKNYKKINFSKSIQLNNVSFSYNSDSEILKNINIKINKGDRICLVGKSGSGKSTMLDLIIGFLKPTKGSIFFDDINIENLSPSYIKSIISNVPQNIFISNSTIIENIAPGIPLKEINVDKINKILKMVSLDLWIDSLEDGIYTVLFEDGKNLSGGQKQRLGIARSLYKDPKIIIFDEATSSLDKITENNIIKTINELSKEITIIFITHNLDLKVNYDYKYNLKDKNLIKIR